MKAFKLLGETPVISTQESFAVELDILDQGVTQTPDFFVLLEEEHITIYDRKCDHSGGKLCMRGDLAICPMHEWKFNPLTGGYSNIQLNKAPLDFIVKDDHLLITKDKEIPALPKSNEKKQLKIEFIEHACLIFESDCFAFAMDPWVIGPAFVSGWWPKNYPVQGWREKLNALDFIYISHNHPDHLNAHTLKEVRKDMKFIVPSFASDSVGVMLKDLGFDDIDFMEFGKYYQYKDTDLFLTILKSGDFRDDSGLYFTYGDFSFLSSVDSHDLNFGKLPTDVTIYASSFAGGSSGFPLCFDTVEISEKEKIIYRNLMAKKATVRNILSSIKPKFYLPYAGFFQENANRDAYIKEHNKKNSIDDYIGINDEREVLDIRKNDVWSFNGEELYNRTNSVREQKLNNPEEWMSENLPVSDLSLEKLERYFKYANFKDDIIVFLALTSDDFSQVRTVFKCDFTNEKVSVNEEKLFDWESIKNDSLGSPRLLYIRVRADALEYVINNALPWEELSIGFQCRIDRIPNVYNVEFWDYFTNVYIADKVKSKIK